MTIEEFSSEVMAALQMLYENAPAEETSEIDVDFSFGSDARSMSTEARVRVLREQILRLEGVIEDLTGEN